MLKVSYILGFERTGSTLFHDLLALNNDSIGVGESRHIYKQYLPNKNTICGCGEKFKECPFWKMVIDKVEEDSFDPKEIKIQDSSIHNLWKSNFYRLYLDRLYHTIADLTDRSQIVDSSKSIYQAILLNSMKNIEVRIYHTRKNPNAVYASLVKRSFTHHKYVGYRLHLKLVKHELTIFSLDCLGLFLPITNITIDDIHALSKQTPGNGINHSCGGSPSKNKSGGKPIIKQEKKEEKVPVGIKVLMAFSRMRYTQITK